MSSKRLAIFTLAMLAGCGGGGSEHAAADSLSRDLQRLPVDSSATFADTATPVAQPAAQPVAVKPKPQPKPKPKPAPKPAPAPAPAPAPKVVASGTVLATAIDAEISSKVNKVGERVTTTVKSDIVDSTGRVLIPAGSKVMLTISEIHESENKGDKTGKLTLTPTMVQIGGESYALAGTAVALDRYLKSRPTNGGDVAKVGAGTAIGAVAGRVIGGNTKGAVIGGLIGGAIGTQRAIETHDRDVIVPAGSRVELKLSQELAL
ncbi:MAG TPA: hypothetical protein VJQ44_19470 [Gemmatimonadales bacterium]|nr:hypothetical protein [Gemmatimonadales bacterium]